MISFIMKNFTRIFCYAFMLILAGIAFSGCNKDNEPSIPSDLDPQLIGTWELKMGLQSAYADIGITFGADGKMKLDAKAGKGTTEPAKDISISATYTAKEGVIHMTVTESADPELIGQEKDIKYEILVNQLYIQYLPLFPFDRVSP